MNNQTTEQTELETVDMQEWDAMLGALERLEGNKDFQKVILDGYITRKALDAVSLLSDPAIKQRGQRGDVVEEITSISNFQYYLQMIHQFGAGARADLEDDYGPEVEEYEV